MTPIRFVLSLFLVAAPALAQSSDPCATAPQTCATLINTQATASTRLPNTVVDISVAVTTSDKDIPSVQRALSQRSVTLLTYLKGQSVQRLITNAVSFKPETRSTKSGPDKTLGYEGTLHISFRTTPDKAPDLLAGVLNNGANTIANTSFNPAEEELAAARRMLSGEATRKALAEAEAIAEAAKLHVVAVRKIDVVGDVQNIFQDVPVAGLTMAEDYSRGRIETSSGDRELAVSANVTIAAAPR